MRIESCRTRRLVYIGLCVAVLYGFGLLPCRTTAGAESHDPASIRVGDTRERVIAVLGEPKGASQGDDGESLLFENGWVDIRDGSVVRVHLRPRVSDRERRAAQARALQEREAFLRKLRKEQAPAVSPGENGKEATSEPSDQPPTVAEGLSNKEVLRLLESSLESQYRTSDFAITSRKRDGGGVICTFEGHLEENNPVSVPIVGPRGTSFASAEPISVSVTGTIRARREGSTSKYRVAMEGSDARSEISLNYDGTMTKTRSASAVQPVRR